MAYKIDKNKCVGCHACAGVCPAEAIKIDTDGKCFINKEKCMSCGTCASVCPMSAVEPDL